MIASLENINFSYKGTKAGALKNFNLKIQQGECILLTGPSGCGKTTITRILNGLLPSFYKGDISGKAMLDQNNIADMKNYEIAEHVGSVFQNPRTQFFNVDTDSEIVFGLENSGISTEKINERLKTVSRNLKIEKLRGRDIFKLSGGEKQKIAFASVYAMSPDIFLLDEPSSNLDTEGIYELAECLKRVKKEGKTIIVADHRIYYLMDIVDKIIYMKEGEIRSIYKRDEFLKIGYKDLNSMGMRVSRLKDLTSVLNKTGSSSKIEVIDVSEKIKKPGDTDIEGIEEDAFSMENKDVLSLKELSIRRGKRELISNLNLNFRSGEIVGITGRNGLGKTTFLRSITGLHKEYTGEIYFNGKKIKPKELLKKSYLVMQDVNYQLFAESVREECSLGIKGVDKERVDQVLDELGLLDYADKHPNTLSGGQKQRLALAVSIISKRKIIALDEPTSGLDYENMIRTSKIIKKLANDNKMIIIVTHDEEFIANCCNRVVRLDNTVEDLRSSDYMSAAHMEYI